MEKNYTFTKLVKTNSFYPASELVLCGKVAFLNDYQMLFSSIDKHAIISEDDPGCSTKSLHLFGKIQLLYLTWLCS